MSRRCAAELIDDGSISPPQIKRRRLSKAKQRTRAGRDTHITIYSWNVNGITPFLQPNKITAYFSSANVREDPPEHDLRDFLRRYDWPTVLFLQEVKINRNDTSTIRAVQQVVKRRPNEEPDAHDYEAHFCLPRDRYNARGFGGKVYGVCSMIRSDFAQRYVQSVREVEWDQEGRFLIIETQARNALPKLALINVYAVNGTSYDYKNPETGQVAGTRHDRKLEVHRSLQKECRELEDRDFDVVVAGDLNIARSPLDGHPSLRTFPYQHCLNRADFEAKFFQAPQSSDVEAGECLKSGEIQAEANGLGMIDTFRQLHPEKRGYTYYSRSASVFGDSCDRVDMIIASQTLKGHLSAAGMHETPAERGPSDHVPLYACFDFGGQQISSSDRTSEDL